MYTSTTQQNVMSLRGLSTDTKPVDQMWLENGSVFLEMDTCKVFVYDGENKVWIEQTDGGEGGDIVIDNDLSSTSENPVQNKVITNALGNKADLVGGKVPENQLPSYVDDVLEYASESAFPAEGESGKIYVALDTNITYRWSGSAYVQVGPEGDIVIANPTLDGTEDELTGLQVGETKYKVPGGGSGDKLYEHNIKIAKSDFQIYIKVYSTLSTAFTQTDLENYFEERKNTFLTCSGYNEAYGVKEAYVGYIYPVDKYNVRIYYTDLTDFNSDKVVNMANISKDTSNATISDTVIQVANAINVAPDIHLYLHNISYRYSNNWYMIIQIYNSLSIKMNELSIATYLYNNNFRNRDTAYCLATGFEGATKIFCSCFSTTGVSVQFFGVDTTTGKYTTEGTGGLTFNDEVIQII